MKDYKFGDLSLLISNKKVENSAEVIKTEFELKSEENKTSKIKKGKRKSNDKQTNILSPKKSCHIENENNETTCKPKKKKHIKLNSEEKTSIENSLNKNDVSPRKEKNRKTRKNQQENENVTSIESVKTDSQDKMKIDTEKQADINSRTIFVGNWPLKKEKKHLKKYFKQYGTVETVRFRSIPVGDTRIPKKVTAITKQFHPDRTSTNAYVQFADEVAAKRALAANGSCVDEHHLRVTLSTSNGDHDPKKSIFVGNIHFQAEEDDLWKIFGDCGEIDSVKIVRDQKTGISKGMGYVNFKSLDGVELALKMDTVNIKDRPIRIKRVQMKVIKNVKKEKQQQEHSSSNAVAYERRKGKKALKSFQGVQFTQKLKKKMKKNKMVKRLQKKNVKK